MPGIYERMNPQLQGALDAALRNRQAYRDRQDARLRDSVGAFNKALPIFGRSIEQALEDTDPRVANDPAYRAARFDYEFSGDRSGLDAIRNRIAQEDAVKEQQAFTDKQRRASELFQAAENEKNREIQRQQNAHSKIMDKAKMLRDYNTYNDIIDDIDTNKSAYGTKWQIERAKAVNNRDMQKELMKSSGLFTPEELGEKPAGAVQIPFRVGYVPEATPAAAQEAAPEETPKPTYADWMKQEPLIVSAIKGRDWANAEKLIGELDPNDLGLQKDVGKYRDQVDAGKKADAAAAADRKRHETVADSMKDEDMMAAINSGKNKFTGSVDGKAVDFDIKYNNKTNEYDFVYKGKVYKSYKGL